MDFPAFVPSSRNYNSGDYAVRTFRAQSGAESRILYGDTRFGATLELQYQNVTDKNAQTFVGHYENVKGTYGTFTLPLRVIEGWDGSVRLLDRAYKNQRNTTATYTDQQGQVQTAEPYETRFAYDENGNSTGIFLEEEGVNLWRNSTNLTIGCQFWEKALTNEVTAPGNGLATKYICVEFPLFLRQFFSPAPLPAGTYTASIYIYVPTQENVPNWVFVTDYNDANGQQTQPSEIFDRWVRVSTTTTVPDSTFIDFNTTIGGGLFPGYTFYAWGAQLEEGSTFSSYIPSSGEETRRAADKIVSTGAWRYAEPPEITNVRPGISNARVRLISVV